MTRWISVAGAIVVLSLSPPLLSGQTRFSDQAVGQAIKKGVDYLWSKQRGDHWAPYGEAKDAHTYNPAGPTALIAYALLEADVSPQEPKMERTLAWLAGQKSDKIYTLGLRCNVWLAANAKTRGKYYKNLEEDTRALTKADKSGAYGYYTDPSKGEMDNSNSQYGLLGAWAGSRGGVEVPREYWETVLKHWIRCQNTDGGWGYRAQGDDSGTTGTMVGAGVASLYVCYDYVYTDKFVSCGLNTEFAPIKKGLDWFDRHFVQSLGSQTGGMMGHGDIYYHLYGVERVGLASGYKYFGQADWYKLGVQTLLKEQEDNGAFTGGNRTDEISTAYALLFLVRGRASVLFNKLEREGDWCNRPRDLATLTRWITRTFEKPVNWQIINLKVPVREWHDAPMLYVSGCKPPQFQDEDIDKLRTFVNQGGVILSCTEGGGGFGKGMREVYKKMFPKYDLKELPPEHDLYTVQYTLSGRPRFQMLSNGIRPLAIHIEDDVAKFWQLEKVATERWAFDAAANVFMYVSDKSPLRFRGVSLWPEDEKIETGKTVKLARLRHDGDFDPEPLAYDRFALLLARETKVKLDVTGPMPIAELAKSDAKVAAITGTGPLKLTDEDKAGLRKWIEAGGTLIIDAAGGSEKFAESVDQFLVAAYGSDCVQMLGGDSAIYRIKGMEIPQVKYRRAAEAKTGGSRRPSLYAVFVKDRPAIFYSTFDLTGGLLGCAAYPCVGYDPDSAYKLMRNVVLYAAGAAGDVKIAPPRKDTPKPPPKKK